MRISFKCIEINNVKYRILVLNKPLPCLDNSKAQIKMHSVLVIIMFHNRQSHGDQKASTRC